LFELTPGLNVRAADPEIHRELNRYLNLMAPHVQKMSAA